MSTASARALALVLLLSLPLVAPTVPADVAEPVAAFQHALPSPRASAASATDGARVWLFGGAADFPQEWRVTGATDEIVEHDPATRDVRVVARLPSPRAGAAAVWTGDVAYVLGGVDDAGSVLDEIVRFDPATGTVDVMPTRLPTPRAFAGAFWHEGAAYVLGGLVAATPAALSVGEVWRYRPSTGVLEPMTAQLDGAHVGAAVAWDGAYAWIVGGASVTGASLAPSARALVFDPASDTAERVATLPRPLRWASGAWDGERVLVAGGRAGATAALTQQVDEVLALDRATWTFARLGALPGARERLAGAWAAGDWWLHGGYGHVAGVAGADAPLDAIARAGAAADAYESWARPAVVWADGRVVAIDGASGQAVEIDPSTGEVARGPYLPFPHVDAHAAVVDGAVYVFGGEGSAHVTRYDPETREATTLGATLPWAGVAHAATTPEGVLLVARDPGSLPRVARFDAAAGSVVPVGGAFAFRVDGVAWDGARAWLFAPDRVYALDAATGEATPTNATYDAADGRRGAFSDGRAAYLLAPDAPALRFDPENEVVEPGATTPRDAGVAWGDGRAYLVGAASPHMSVRVLAYDVAPARVPAETTALARAVAVSWAAPPEGAEVRLYHIGPDGDPTLLANASDAGAYTHAALAPGSGHRYRVVARDASGDGLSTWLDATVPIEAPDAPRDLVAERGHVLGEIRLTWSPPALDGGRPVVGFRVYGGDSADALAPLAVVDVATFVDTGLAAGATRFYSVTALSDAGEGARAGTVSARAPGAPEAPPAPRVERLADDALRLSWEAPADDGGLAIAGYLVLGGPPDAPPTELARLPPEARSHDDGPFAPRVARRYFVVAFNEAGTGASSEAALGATASRPREPPPPTWSRPAAGEIALSWRAPTETDGMPILGYRVYASPRAGALVPIADVDAGSLSFTDATLARNELRDYAVTAITAAGESVRSVRVSTQAAREPDAPRDVVARPDARVGDVLLTWSAPANDGGLAVLDHLVERRAPGGAWEVLGATSETRYVDAAPPSGAWEYAVRARNDVGPSARSSSALGAGLPR